MTLNGKEITSIEQLEDLIVDFDENTKQYLRNTFNGIVTQPNVIVPLDFYDKTQTDGRNAVNSLMRELKENSQVNNLPRIVNRTIEDAFKPVTDALLWGWWITAREKLDTIQVGGFITQELYDRIRNTIDNYIAQNY